MIILCQVKYKLGIQAVWLSQLEDFNFTVLIKYLLKRIEEYSTVLVLGISSAFKVEIV